MKNKHDRHNYVTGVDFLPPNGFLYVDSCGIDWIGKKKEKSDEYCKARLERIINFYHSFKERGNVITTNMILGEMKDGFSSLKKIRNKMNGCVRHTLEINNNDIKRDIRCISEYVKAYEQTYALLRDNTKKYVPREYVVQPKTAKNFVEEFNQRNGKKLSFPDKELIIAALSSGPVSSLLTADIPMMEAYCSGIKEFYLWNHSLCNAIESTISYLHKR